MIASGDIHQRSFGGQAELRGSTECRLQDALHHGNCPSGDHEPPRIERRGYQVSPLRINKVAGGRVAGVRSRSDQVPSFARPEQLDGNLRIVPIGASIRSSKEHGVAAGQKLRPAVAALVFRDLSQWLGGTSRIRHYLES
jgi:hypothetical protein